MLPPAKQTDAPAQELEREPARDTLAPSSFGTLGNASKPAAAPTPALRAARPPMNTLGELEGLSATATLRPPGAVPPPPRALPMATPNLDAQGLGSASAIDTPLPAGVDLPFAPLAGDLPPSPKQPRFDPPPQRSEPVPPAPTPFTADATVVSGGAPPATAPAKKPEVSLDATLDMQSTASKKATQAALIEQTRGSADGAAERPSSAGKVPAPGLYIADEPVEPRPKQASLVTVPRQVIGRMRVTVLLLGGLLLMLAGALVVMIFRRTEANAIREAAASASAAPVPPGCALAAPPSRISPIERSVPISVQPLADGTLALAIADTKTSAQGWRYNPIAGELGKPLQVPAGGGDVSHVSASDPVLVDRGSADFAFAQTLGPGLALGVGPAGLLRRGDDGGSAVVWPLGTGVRVTPPRVATLPTGHFVAFRQGGAEGQLLAGWLKPDGSAAGSPTAIEGAPKSLGTPNVAPFAHGAVALFPARGEKTEPYRVYAAIAQPFEKPSPARALELPAEGGGAIAPSLVALSGDRYLVQWTDGNVGGYQVHTRLFDAALEPAGEPLLVSAKGANAGQGTVVASAQAIVSFFIQTTAGHDELWGATLSCH